MGKERLPCSHPVMRGIQFIEWAGLSIIVIAIIVAIYQEVELVIDKRKVELHDILLLFIYLEVITMVALYLTSGKLPVRYPIYIAIVAIARFIILDLKDMDSKDVIWFSVSMLILTLAALVLRFGSKKYPYDERID